MYLTMNIIIFNLNVSVLNTFVQRIKILTVTRVFTKRGLLLIYHKLQILSDKFFWI